MICTFLCVPYLIKGQSYAAIEQQADSLFSQGNFPLARLVYERAVFTLGESGLPGDTVQQLTNRFLLKKTYCYKASGDFTQAQKTIERSNWNNLPDSLAFPLRYEAAICTYLAKNFNDAYNYILQLKYFIKDTTLTRQVDFLEILTLNEMTHWEEAKKLTEIYIQKYHLQADANELYDFLKNPKIRNPKKAEMLATYLPGVGQWYAGYPARGIVSASLQLACFSFGAYSIWKGYYLSGFFTGFVLLQAFYTGGIRHTMYLTEKKNKEKIEAYNGKVRKFLLKAEANQ